jgi:hypothetical protein
MSKKVRRKSRKRRNHVKPEDLWDTINSRIDSYKETAINWSPTSGLSKNDTIHAVVRNFISDIIRNCRPQPELFQRWVNGEKISMNMMLNSIGNVGVVIGAAAFQLAEQLQIELPENATESTINAVVPVIDGEFRNEMASVESKVSGCYLDYFLQDDKAMLRHKVYLAQCLKQKYEDDKNQVGWKVIEELLTMDIFCPSLFDDIYFCLIALMDGRPIVEYIEGMLQSARSSKQNLEGLSKESAPNDNEESKRWVDLLCCIDGCEAILGLLANKAA